MPASRRGIFILLTYSFQLWSLKNPAGFQSILRTLLGPDSVFQMTRADKMKLQKRTPPLVLLRFTFYMDLWNCAYKKISARPLACKALKNCPASFLIEIWISSLGHNGVSIAEDSWRKLLVSMKNVIVSHKSLRKSPPWTGYKKCLMLFCYSRSEATNK